MILPPERRLRPGDGPFFQRLPVGTRNLLLTVEYDGASFAGWQLQPGQRTVQGELQGALARLLRHEAIARGAGRTDAGVHAWAQRACVFTDSGIDLRKVVRGIGGVTRYAVVCVAAREVDLAFDPRRDSQGKVYRYRVLNRPEPSPLRAGRVWHVRPPLDVELMRSELTSVLGLADFSAYRAADCGSPEPVKQLRRVEVERDGDEVVLTFEGSGFLKQMVRILVGTAVEVGAGRMAPQSMARILGSRQRAQAGPTAPAAGLALVRVSYEGEGA